MTTYRFCRTCREREGDCHCGFLGSEPRWEIRDAQTHVVVDDDAPAEVRS